jgi:hypothetical protein
MSIARGEAVRVTGIEALTLNVESEKNVALNLQTASADGD